MSRLTESALRALDGTDSTSSASDDGQRSASDVSVAFDSQDELLDRLMTPRNSDGPRSPFLSKPMAVTLQRSNHDHDEPDENLPGECTEWYFAYGSNMNVAQLITRIGDFKEKKLLYLPNFMLVFNKKVQLRAQHRMSNVDKCGFANVVPCERERVYGIAYLVRPSQMEAMDVFEGVHSGHYTRELMTCYDPNNEPVVCHVYVACPSATGDHLLPSEGYLSHLLGGRGLLPSYYSNWLMKHPTIKRQY